MGDRTTWRQELAAAQRRADDQNEIIAYAPDAAAFVVEFDSSYGSPKGPDVLAWTETRVYFPVTYDGSEWMESAPRHPTTEGQEHIGGW